MTLAALVATGFPVAAVHAFFLLRQRTNEFHRSALAIALVVGYVFIPLQILSGDLSARKVAQLQPAKLAAMEAHYHSSKVAPLIIGGLPNDETQRTRFGLLVPHMSEDVVAAFMVAALIIYALMGGADFGGGFWDLLGRGPAPIGSGRPIARAIGPIWEANHVWLILVIVLLFTGFPRVRRHDDRAQSSADPDAARDCAARFRFCFSKIRSLLGDGATSLEPALWCGQFLHPARPGNDRGRPGHGTDPRHEKRPNEQDDFRKRALWTGFLLGPIAACVFFTAQKGAPGHV